MGPSCPTCGDHRIEQLMSWTSDGWVTIRCKGCKGIYPYQYPLS